MSDHRAAGRTSVIGRPSRRRVAVLVVLATVLVAAGTTWFTGASFTSSTFGQVLVQADDDYKPPTVAVTSPGATVSGTVQVQATASDTASGVASVRIEYAAAGSSTWTALCTDTTSPYSCAWSTTTVADGDYQLRAIADDVAGFTATSTVVTTRVANPASVLLSTIPDAVRGTVAISATITGAAGRTTSSRFEFRISETTGSWTSITGCAAVLGTTPSCSWNTGTLTNSYDVRVVSTIGTGATALTREDEQTDVVVDNKRPTVGLSAPEPMTGTVSVVSTPVDDDSGVERVELSYRAVPLVGSPGAYTALCTVPTTPYRCNLNTTTLVSGLDYQLRAIAVDVAGNVSTETVITRRVSNGLASVSITSPVSGDAVRGTTLVTADTQVPALNTVTSVRFETRPAGGSFTTLCTDTTAPYGCDWATASLPTGGYELRAVMAYTTGTVTSTVVAVTVDNSLRALDVQTLSGGTVGQPTSGDKLVLTYQGALDLRSVKPGWDGSSTPVTATFSDKDVAPSGSRDRLTFDANLGTVTFGVSYVRSGRTAAIPATMTATTTTAGSVTTTTVTVTLAGGSSNLRTSTSKSAMQWTPSAAARSTTGQAAITTMLVEPGVSDSDW